MTRQMFTLRRLILATLVLCTALMPLRPASAAADARVIVRTGGLLDGLTTVQTACSLIGCTVVRGIDGTLGHVFLVTKSNTDPISLVVLLTSFAGITSAEPDLVVHTLAAEAGEVPPALLDATPVSYYGTTVRRGYVEQPATGVIGLAAAQARYSLTGSGITVAVIDTGVDPNHPVLAGLLKGGYDFTRNVDKGSEMSDVDQSTVATLDDAKPAYVNQSTVATLDQSTVATLDTSKHAAFGHGTMVAGVVHLVAPRASIMPLKAFAADGSGYTSDVLRAVYYAVANSAKVINMSFSFATPSAEMTRAVQHAQSKRVITVASAGNDGLRTIVYPAGTSGVIGVASTTDYDTLSTFSNFGADIAFVTAPGEAIVTTYPFGTYAAAWGTSFSAPFAAGTAALLAEQQRWISPSQASDDEGHAVWISSEVKRGRLDIPAAIKSARSRLGLP